VRVCLLSKDDAAPKFPHVKKTARSRPAVFDGSRPRQQRSAPDLTRRGAEAKRRSSAGFGEDKCRRCSAHGLGPAANAKPGVILMRRQSAKPSVGVIAFASARPEHAEHFRGYQHECPRSGRHANLFSSATDVSVLLMMASVLEPGFEGIQLIGETQMMSNRREMLCQAAGALTGLP